MHENGGFHYHAVAKNASASKKTAARNIREIFPEFEGAQCNVRFPKGLDLSFFEKKLFEESKSKILTMKMKDMFNKKNPIFHPLNHT